MVYLNILNVKQEKNLIRNVKFSSVMNISMFNWTV